MIPLESPNSSHYRVDGERGLFVLMAQTGRGVTHKTGQPYSNGFLLKYVKSYDN